METENKKLFEFLSSLHLGQYMVDISISLGVTRLEHLENVREEDLVTIGLSPLEIRRLFDSVKKLRRRSIFSKLRKSFRIPSASSPEVTHDVNNEMQCIIDEKELTFGNVIGSGAFGYVQQAEWISHTTKTLMSVAVKILQQTHPQTSNTEFLLEANAMVILNHPNLIRLYGVVLSTPFMLVTELAPLGSLSKRLKDEPEKFLISNLCSFVIQIAAGMKYLEANRVVHRDLAARNILLMSYEKVKIGDFGLARPLQQDTDCYVMESNGLVPYAWCAPECLNFRKFSHASDVWAFGVTVMEMFSYGIEPWIGLTGSQILEKIDEPNFERPQCPDHCPKSIYSIIKDLCWNHNAEERGQFSVLEKCILNVLPYEVRALNNRFCNSPEMLSFSKKDSITVFDKNEEAFWRGQNRNTLQVGILPASYVDLSRGTVSDSTEETLQVVHGNKDGRPSSSIDDYRYLRKLSENYVDGSPHSLKERISFNRESFSSSICSSPDTRSHYSFCEECTSQMSYDSGCFCRCSTYSSSSSKRSSGTSVQSVYVKSTSNPIGIPGGKNSMKNHRKNKDIYEVSQYDSHSIKSSTPKSITSEVTSSTVNLPTSRNGSITSNNLYDNIDSLSINTRSSSIDSRQSLPDIVNPTKPTKILDRRRSLPRLKNKRAKSFENKLYKSQSIISTDSSLDNIRCRSATENINTSKSVFYDTVPNPILSASTTNITPSQPYQSHKRTAMSESSDIVDNQRELVMYDVVPTPKPKIGNKETQPLINVSHPIYHVESEQLQQQQQQQPPLYEEISNVMPVKKTLLLDEANVPLDKSMKTFETDLYDVKMQPFAPPRIKKKQKKTNEVNNQVKIKQCVILQIPP